MPYAYQRGDNCYGRGDYYRGDYYRGDPGLFGFLGKAAKTITGVVSKLGIPGVSAVAGAAHGVLNKLSPPSANVGPAMNAGLMIGPPLLPQTQTGIINIAQGVPVGGVQGPVGTMTPQGFLPGLCNIKGTRPNKSSYYRAVPGNPMAGVLIPKGSVCVKTRRLNVANPRALRRAIRRAQGFAKLARRVISFTGGKVSGRGRFKKRSRR